MWLLFNKFSIFLINNLYKIYIMVIKALLGLKVLKLTFLCGMATAWLLQKYCSQKKMLPSKEAKQTKSN